MKRPFSLSVTLVTAGILFSLGAMFFTSYSYLRNNSSMVKETRSRGIARPQDAPPPDSATAPSPGEQTRSEISEQQTKELLELMRALQSSPNDADVLRRIGEFFLSTRDLKRATFFLNRALLSRPSDTRSLCLLGIAHSRQDRIPEATKSFEDVLQIKKDLEAMYYLAIIYKRHNGKKTEAETLLRSIIASPEADADILDRAKSEL
jgi:tetratricopeptide (TPR) repeat protein